MFWALIFLVLSLPSFAQDLTEVSKILQTTVTPEIECTPETLDDSSLETCAQDVCGSPGSVPSAFLNGDELEGFELSSEAKVEFDRTMDLLTKAGNDWLVGMLTTMQGFETFLDNSPEEFNPAIISVSYLLNRYASFQVKGDEIKVVPRFSPEMDPGLKKGIMEWIAGKEIEAKTDPLLRLHLGLNTPEQSMTAMKLKWDEINKTTMALPADDKIRKEFEKSISEVQELTTGEISETDVFKISNYITGFKAMLNPMDAEKGKALDHNVFEPSCKKDCLEALRPLISKATLKKAIAEVNGRLDEQFKEFQLGCATSLGIQAKNGQLPGQREKALGLVKGALDKVTAQPWWSSHTKESFRKHIQDKVTVAHQFNSEKLVTLENLTENQKFIANKLNPQIFMNTLLKSANSSYNSFTEAIPFCPSPRVSVSDAYYRLEEPLIQVSPYSCAHPEVGEGIVAHELGHALSSFMKNHSDKSPESAKKYKEIRRCVTKQAPEYNLNLPDQPPLHFSGDNLTAEEDTADWLAHHANLSGFPSSCSFLPQKDGKYLRKGLEIRPMAEDSHSSSLLRAIRQHHVKQKN